MPDPTQIALALKGPRGPASLSDFSVAVGALRNTVRNVARCVTGLNEIEYDVTDLRYGSAAIDVAPPAEVRPIGIEIASLYKNTVAALEDGNPLDPRIDYTTIHAFNGFSSIAKNPGTALLLTDRTLSQRFADNVAAVLEPDVKSFGSATGRLEGMSIHNVSTFTLYPPVAGESIECVFARDKLDDVLRAVDSIVTVFGKMHYAKTKAFPVRCEVESFERSDIPEVLPTLLNACGILGGNVPSEVAIRGIRNEW